MKSYDEMAGDVFRRIKEYNARQQKKKQRAVRTLTGAACLCAMALICIGIWHSRHPDNNTMQKPPFSTPVADATTVPGSTGQSNSSFPSSPLEDPSAAVPAPFLYLCTPGKGGTQTLVPVQPYLGYESRIQLDFIAIHGFDDDRIEEERNACEAKLQAAIAELGSQSSIRCSCTVLQEAGYIVSKLAANSFALDLDLEKVARITVTNTSAYGQIDVFGANVEPGVFLHGKAVSLEKEQITDKLSFSWNYRRINDYFSSTAQPRYEDLNDTFHFTVEYEDGTVVTAALDIVFDASGTATICCTGYKAAPV